jgi:parvulin-like peptidyl-prolyl isomerase
MLFRMALASLYMAQTLSAAPTVAARINGKPILETELTRWIERDREKGRSTSRAEALERLILFRLSLDEAHRRKLEKRPEVKEAVDRALYKGFLDDLKAKAGGSFQPSQEELKALYQESPLVRVRHLVLLTDTEEAAKKAQGKLKQINQQLAEGEDFKAVVLKHSEDPSTHLNAGDLDFRGKDSLEDPFYSIARALKPGEVSGPIHHSGGIHILQLLETKPFESAFAPYLSYLEETFREDKERVFLENALASLKRKAKIEITGAPATP